MNLGQTFDAAELPQGGNYDVLPAGWYNAKITDASIKDTKNGTGQYINVRYDITGPTHQGRVVFGKLNIRNATPRAEEIGRQQLGNLMRALGLTKITDTNQLVGGSVSIRLEVKPADGQYSESNDIKGYKSIGGTMPAAAPAFASAAPAAAAPAKAAPPWVMRK
jgi:hypothetical protein